MRVSSNELTSAVEKAVVGSGYSQGTGQSLAKATLNMVCKGQPGLSELLKALQAEPCVPKLDEKPSGWSCDTQQIANGGIALADLKLASAKIDVTDLDCPDLFDAMLVPAMETGAIELEVPTVEWRALLDLAANTYVPATEESRNRGAGAGTNDTD